MSSSILFLLPFGSPPALTAFVVAPLFSSRPRIQIQAALGYSGHLMLENIENNYTSNPQAGRQLSAGADMEALFLHPVSPCTWQIRGCSQR